MQAWMVYCAWDGKPLKIFDVIAAETLIRIDGQFQTKLRSYQHNRTADQTKCTYFKDGDPKFLLKRRGVHALFARPTRRLLEQRPIRTEKPNH
jgi:hypothetical protein